MRKQFGGNFLLFDSRSLPRDLQRGVSAAIEINDADIVIALRQIDLSVALLVRMDAAVFDDGLIVDKKTRAVVRRSVERVLSVLRNGEHRLKSDAVVVLSFRDREAEVIRISLLRGFQPVELRQFRKILFVVFVTDSLNPRWFAAGDLIAQEIDGDSLGVGFAELQETASGRMGASSADRGETMRVPRRWSFSQDRRAELKKSGAVRIRFEPQRFSARPAAVPRERDMPRSRSIRKEPCPLPCRSSSRPIWLEGSVGWRETR